MTTEAEQKLKDQLSLQRELLRTTQVNAETAVKDLQFQLRILNIKLRHAINALRCTRALMGPAGAAALDALIEDLEEP